MAPPATATSQADREPHTYLKEAALPRRPPVTGQTKALQAKIKI